jgi:M6 family metalloprotease-like protein
MRTIHAAVLAVTTLGVCACTLQGVPDEGEADLGETIAELSVTGPTPVGDVTVVVPAEAAPVLGPRADWRPVPGLSGAIQSAARANLTVTVTAEMFGTAGAYVRPRVDGQPLGLEPLFVAGAQVHDDVRSFTFVVPTVAAGQHTVEIEWRPLIQGARPQMRDRSLTMHSAAAGSGTGRLAVADSSGGGIVFVSPFFYQAVPGATTSITTAQSGPLAITFSGDVLVAEGRLFAQAVVDGVVVSDVLFLDAGFPTRDSHSYTFVTPSVSAGLHRVEIRARVEGGVALFLGRSVAVASAPGFTAAGGMVATGLQAPPTPITSTSYVDVPSMATIVSTAAGASTVVIDAGGEVLVRGGRLFLRALVDGVPAQPGNVTFLQRETRFRAQSFAFAVDNLPPGRHTIGIQAAVDPNTTALIADRFLRVHHARRSGAAFVRPYEAMRPKSRVFQTLVICFDPVRPGHPRPTKQQLMDMFEGTDSGKSMRGWWAESSGERLTAGTVQYRGCEDTGWYPPPPGREGTWYWDNGQFNLMWQDALRAADPTFDFHAYDTDRDNAISPDELLVAIVRPQAVQDGTTRGTSVALDGNPTPLGVHVSDLYLSADPARRTANVGVICHELAHSFIGGQDLYAPCPPETNAGSFSIMSAYGNATHLDPLHKLKSGFVTPDAVDISTWTTASLPLPAVETGDNELAILFDPAKADKEYFVVENRFGGSGTSANYDAPLGNNVVLWHVIEDRTTRITYPFPAPPPNDCRIPIRLLKALSAAGDSHDLVWADGTPAKIRVTLQLAGATANVELAKLP